MNHDKQADELAALPSCEERQRMIERARTTRQLVCQLRAHDQTNCAECAAVRMATCDDCGLAVAPHVTSYDPEYRLTTCPACAVKQARIDSIVERHNAERAAA